MRENQRQISKSQRDLERERQNLQNEEKKVMAEIKKCLTKGDQTGAKVLAKQLISIRNQQKKMLGMKSHLGAVSTRAQSAKANQVLAKSMQTSTQVMQSMNKQFDVQKTAQITRDFQQQQQVMDMSSEMIDDAVEGIFETDDNEVDEAMSEVLDSVGIDLHSQLSSAKTGSSNLNRANRAPAIEEEEDDNALIERLARLK